MPYAAKPTSRDPGMYERVRAELEELNNTLAPDRAYLYWYGDVFNTTEATPRVDTTHLYLIHKPEGAEVGAMFRVVLVRICENVEVGPPIGIEPMGRILCTTDPVFRVNEGEDRHGMHVLADNIQRGESVCRAGIRKLLQVGDRAHQLRIETKAQERFQMEILANLLESLRSGTCPETSRIEFPEFILCQKHRRRLVPRSTALVYTHKEYRSKESFETSLDRIRRGFEIDMGEGRIGYPFDVFNGQGVIACRIPNDWGWTALKLEAGGTYFQSEPHVLARFDMVRARKEIEDRL